MPELSEEQILELQQKAARVEELEKFKNESEAKLNEYETARSDWEKKEKEYQEQVNPNWQKARKTMDAMKEALKSKGVQMDDDGNILSNPSNINVDELLEKTRAEANLAAERKLIDVRLEELLDEYDVESAKVVRHFYQKLTAGESVTLKNVKDYIRQAESAARGSETKITRNVASFSSGQGPRQASEQDVDSSAVEGLANLMGLNIKK